MALKSTTYIFNCHPISTNPPAHMQANGTNSIMQPMYQYQLFFIPSILFLFADYFVGNNVH